METLVLGGYLYTTAAVAWLFRRVDRLASNHLKHIDRRLSRLEDRLGTEDK